MTFEFEAGDRPARRAHVGVVGSGDLEVLLEPRTGDRASVVVRTSVDGYREIWTNVLQRFFARRPVAAAIEINDFGATPGVVTLRLAQAVEEAMER
jgi:malonate decarboxylase delta subunit